MAAGDRAETRTLVVLRHAKSAWGLDVDDHDRPLSKRGRRDAEAVGAFLAERKLAADLVWCSSAVRAQETWRYALVGGARAEATRHDERIYEAVAAELVALLRSTPDDVHTAIIVGHAPGIPDLVEELATRNGKDTAWNQMDTKYPTSGCAVINFDGSWADLRHGSAELESFDVPRGPKDATSEVRQAKADRVKDKKDKKDKKAPKDKGKKATGTMIRGSTKGDALPGRR